MAGMVGREREETLGLWDHKENKESKDILGLLGYLVPRGQWERRGSLGTVVYPDLGENLVVTGRREVLGRLVQLDLRGSLDLRDRQVEGQSTLAGGGPLVPVTRELS